MNKKLYHSNINKMLYGVCGDMREYFNIDPTIVHFIWAILTYFSPGVITYFIAAIVIPLAPN